jgi:hypothetical protein
VTTWKAADVLPHSIPQAAGVVEKWIIIEHGEGV